MHSLVSPFHSGMLARVRFGGEFSESIEDNNGLRQDCAISPVLFNLFFAPVLDRWQDVFLHQCPGEQFLFLRRGLPSFPVWLRYR